MAFHSATLVNGVLIVAGSAVGIIPLFLANEFAYKIMHETVPRLSNTILDFFPFEKESVIRSLYFSAISALMGAAMGTFLTAVMLSVILRGFGLNTPFIDLCVLLSVESLLIGGIPGFCAGYVIGRLVYSGIHNRQVLVQPFEEIISAVFEARHRKQQARKIIALNELPFIVGKPHHLPPEVMSHIHSYLVYSSEKDSFDLINKEIIADRNSYLRIIKNKYRFFVSSVNNSISMVSRIDSKHPEGDAGPRPSLHQEPKLDLEMNNFFSSSSKNFTAVSNSKSQASFIELRSCVESEHDLGFKFDSKHL